MAVRDPNTSEEFYDRVTSVLGFRKREMPINGDLHVVYFNRQFAYSLRPARGDTSDHDPYAPGLRHLCFRVVDEAAVDRARDELRAAGLEVAEPRYYPEYGPDYHAIFFEDPDGLRLEVMNFAQRRRKIMYDWEARANL